MTFSERMYLQDQEAQRFDAENAPCDCGERLCYQCGPAYDEDAVPDEQDGPAEELFENAEFEGADDRYGSWEDEAAIVDYGD